MYGYGCKTEKVMA
jgi:hypothetical protein